MKKHDMRVQKTRFIPVILVGLAVSAAAIEIGPLDIGGAIRANYVNGDYVKDGTDAAQRGDNGGDFDLDTFRINLDLEYETIIGKAEYRWYSGYNFLHTGWLGLKLDENSQIIAGLNRVPFGVGAYGPANSWFFDQHYYVGLSDDMDYGVRYTRSMDALTLDLAYYLSAEDSFVGASEESARYSYDIVDNGSPYSHYEERNQVNARGIYSLSDLPAPTDVGVSLQWGELKADETFAEDSDSYAASVHTKSTLGNWGLMLQLTSYQYDADYKDSAVDADGMPLVDDLITMGAYDFAWPVASEGVIPAVALSYTWTPEKIEWIDSITFYNDYSIILKDGNAPSGAELNDSALNVTGMAIANDGWYIYVDYAYSDGNYFVGNEGDDYSTIEGVGDFGANGNDTWNGRFNINFGYYF